MTSNIYQQLKLRLNIEDIFNIKIIKKLYLILFLNNPDKKLSHLSSNYIDNSNYINKEALIIICFLTSAYKYWHQESNQVLKPRLLTIKSRSDFTGFGFNMESKIGTIGICYVDRVDYDSPASSVGLLSMDVIVEVNQESIVDCTHEEVVSKMKKFNDYITLLVADQKTIDFYDQQDLQINGEMSDILKRESTSSYTGIKKNIIISQSVW